MKIRDWLLGLACVVSLTIMALLSGPDPDRGEHITVPNGNSSPGFTIDRSEP